MDETKPEIAIELTRLANFENLIFWIERIITITLTCLWIYSYFYFFSYSKESFIFDRVASASAHVFLFTNSLFLVCLFIRISLDAPPNQDPQDEDRKKLMIIERYAFCIERSGTVLLSVLFLPLGYTYVQFLHISRASCIFLFPVANILYSESFILGYLKERRDKYENCSGRRHEVADGNHQTEEKDDTSPLIPTAYSNTTYAEDISVMRVLEEYAGSQRTKTQYDNILDTNRFEELGTETQDLDDNLELDESIPDLEEVEETKEEATEKEKGANNTFSEESFEMLSTEDNQIREGIQELDQECILHNKNDQKMVSFEMPNIQFHQIIRRNQVLEKQLATAKQKYLKKLKKVEEKWERKLKKVAEKYREERQIWEEEKFDLVSRLSAAVSQAEFYYLQAQDREESRQKLEEEKSDLIMKLCAANASSEVYRSLLRDDLGSTVYD